MTLLRLKKCSALVYNKYIFCSFMNNNYKFRKLSRHGNVPSQLKWNACRFSLRNFCGFLVISHSIFDEEIPLWFVLFHGQRRALQLYIIYLEQQQYFHRLNMFHYLNLELFRRFSIMVFESFSQMFRRSEKC